jgi:hypothetical protein
MLKKFVQQGRSEWRAEAYPLGYVEGLNEVRTLLADFFSIMVEDVATENQVRTAEGEAKPEGLWQLQLCDGLDQVLVNGHEVRAILVVDHHVGEADK